MMRCLSLPMLAAIVLLGCDPGERPNGTEAPGVMEAPAEQHEDADTVFLDPDGERGER
jgi:hypothetical protein